MTAGLRLLVQRLPLVRLICRWLRTATATTSRRGRRRRFGGRPTSGATVQPNVADSAQMRMAKHRIVAAQIVMIDVAARRRQMPFDATDAVTDDAEPTVRDANARTRCGAAFVRLLVRHRVMRLVVMLLLLLLLLQLQLMAMERRQRRHFFVDLFVNVFVAKRGRLLLGDVVVVRLLLAAAVVGQRLVGAGRTVLEAALSMRTTGRRVARPVRIQVEMQLSATRCVDGYGCGRAAKVVGTRDVVTVGGILGCRLRR